MRSAILPICALLALSLAAPAARAQGVDPSTPVSSDAPAAATQATPQEIGAAAEPGYAAPAAGLPERAAPPRTLRAYWHVFIAFAVTWVLLFGYALTLGRRFGRVEDELRRLSRAE
jgi:CcmD family protein